MAKFWSRAKVIWAIIIAVSVIAVGMFGILYLSGNLTFFAALAPIDTSKTKIVVTSNAFAYADGLQKITIKAKIVPNYRGKVARLYFVNSTCDLAKMSFSDKITYTQFERWPWSQVTEKNGTTVKADGTAVWEFTSTKPCKFDKVNLVIGLGKEKVSAYSLPMVKSDLTAVPAVNFLSLRQKPQRCEEEGKALYKISGSQIEIKCTLIDTNGQVMPNANVQVEVLDQNNNIVQRGIMTTNEFGRASGSFIRSNGIVISGFVTGVTRDPYGNIKYAPDVSAKPIKIKTLIIE